MKSNGVSERKSSTSEGKSSNKRLALVAALTVTLALGAAAACSTATQRADSTSGSTTPAVQTNSPANNTPVTARATSSIPKPLEEVGHYAETSTTWRRRATGRRRLMI